MPPPGVRVAPASWWQGQHQGGARCRVRAAAPRSPPARKPAAGPPSGPGLGCKGVAPHRQQGMAPVSSQRWSQRGKTGTGAALSRWTKDDAGLHCIGLTGRHRALTSPCVPRLEYHVRAPPACPSAVLMEFSISSSVIGPSSAPVCPDSNTTSEHPLPARRQC